MVGPCHLEDKEGEEKEKGKNEEVAKNMAILEYGEGQG